jgi:phosphoglycerate dehydrogenase-like enzyme
MSLICVPDDDPPVLAPSHVWSELQAIAKVSYYDTLPASEEDLIERIRPAEIVINIRSSVMFTENVFAACPKLRLISIWGTGTDNVDLESARRHGVTVTNTPGVSAASVAEHTLALLFAAARRITAVDAAMRRGEWQRGQSTDLRGKTCGVVGLGAIGRAFAQLAAGIGMRVVAWTLHPRSVPGVELVELEDLYRKSDVVSLHLRLSDETRGFVGARQLAMMKPGVILVNTARGGIIDESALLEALRTGQVAAAGLDVFATEPLPAGNPWIALPNVALTPHCAGMTPEALEAGLRMSVENIWAFQQGRPEHVVV